ncbi:hypothetical protein KY308_03535 [Candidatus Woesearchaeota archaeon]|nr:hypothetical protein [Candidatus Woesearchaeota archaeon]
MVYDSARDRIVLFGGIVNATRKNDTWEYDGAQWTKINTANAPSIRFGHMMVYDSRRNQTVLFGGQNLSTSMNDTWEYNGTNWNKIATGESPKKISIGAMEYDSIRNVTVLFGGSSGAIPINETWEYNGTSWKNMNETITTVPHQRQGHDMVFDFNRGKMVMFGGITRNYTDDNWYYLNDTWEYDGTDWILREFTTPVPAKRQGYVFVYDTLRKVSILIGGTSPVSINDTWEYDGTKWNYIYDVENLPQINGKAVFDSKRNRTVFFGGVGSYVGNVTSEYNASVTEGVVNGTWVFYKQYFEIENDGTVNISVNFSSDKDAGSFLGGTSPQFQIKGKVKETGACPSLVTDYTEMLATPQNICPILRFGQSKDMFRAPIQLRIPNDAPSGEKNATITFTAAKS